MTNAEARFSKSLRPRKPEGSLGRTAQDGHLDSHTAPELCGSGIKMEGLSYLGKYFIGGPEFGIKEEFVTEKRRQFFHAGAMNREACCLQFGQLTGVNWNRRSFGQWLHTGKETTAPHDRTKTQYQRASDRPR